MHSTKCTLILTLILFVNGCSRKSNIPGSIGYVDFKNGMGGMTFGQDIEVFKEQGFVKDNGLNQDDNQNESQDKSETMVDYTNASARLNFGDFYLKDIRLTFASNKLLSIWGFVNYATETDSDHDLNEDLIKHLKVLFGKQTSEVDEDRLEFLSDYVAVNNRTLSWNGSKIRLTIQESSSKTQEFTPTLMIEDYHTRSTIEQSLQLNADREQKKKQDQESDRIRQQSF
jgi:hypothetical protein